MARALTAASTGELLALASAQADQALLAEVVAELVTRYQGLVYNQALRISRGNHALADEVFQETFLRLFTWLRDRPAGPTLHTFPRLLTVFSKRAAIDLMRKEKRETAAGSLEEAEQVPADESVSWETK